MNNTTFWIIEVDVNSHSVNLKDLKTGPSDLLYLLRQDHTASGE